MDMIATIICCIGVNRLLNYFSTRKPHAYSADLETSLWAGLAQRYFYSFLGC